MTDAELLERLLSYIVGLYDDPDVVTNMSWDDAIARGLDPITDLIPSRPVKVLAYRPSSFTPSNYVDITYISEDGKPRVYTVYKSFTDLISMLHDSQQE